MDSTLFSEFNRPPALIIGSGISLRYLEGSKDWVGLLKALATRMGMSNGDFLAYESGAKLEFNKNKISDGLTTHLPYLCYDLEKYLIDSFKNKTLNASEFFTEEEYKQYEEGMDSLKILAASEVQNYKLRTDDKCLGEIELFRKIANVIPCVITTNYDDFLEKEIFQGKFAVYSDVSDYYDPESQGIGEIYKIHGTANNPNSMILNVEDYKSFEKKSAIVSANIMSVLCDYPVLIMGYSLEDPDIRAILNDIASALSPNKLAKFESRIIFVSYKPGENDLMIKPYSFGEHGNRLTIRSIETDNFESIFKELSCMEPSTSPSMLRKLRKLVKKIVISTKPDDSGYILLGMNDSTFNSVEGKVIAIPDQNYVRMLLKNIPNMKGEDLVNYILTDTSEYNPDAIVNHFLNARNVYRKDQYVPIYHYLLQVDKSIYIDSEFLKKYTEIKKDQFDRKITSSACQNILGGKSIRTAEDSKKHIETLPNYKRAIAIFYCTYKGILSPDEATEVLKWTYVNRDRLKIVESDVNLTLTYIGFVKWSEKQEQ